MTAIRAHGQVPRWCGVLPTPAIAAAALGKGVPAIVITGSHIPEDYNGIKFYRPDGELLKADEEPIRTRVEKHMAQAATRETAAIPAGRPDPDLSVDRAYVRRYFDAFGPEALSGLRLGVFEHSAAGRDLLVEILAGLGADLVRFGRSEIFIAVDTEALEPSALSICAEEISRHDLDAVVSTDGDGDRPLLIGADGRQITGDVLCTLAARALGIQTLVTPLTSTGAIEMCGWFDKIVRTRVGSPHVVAAMNAETGSSLAGFEANGGFLLGSALDLPGGRLSALPTRDAMLPLIAVLAEAGRRAISLAQLVAELPARVMKADRLKQIPPEVSARFLMEIQGSAALRARLAPELAEPAAVDLMDGVRLSLTDGTVVHFRASGNAPELRVYVETDDAMSAAGQLNTITGRLADVLSDWSGQAGQRK